MLRQLLISGDALDRRFTYDPIYRLLSATGRECDRPPEGKPWEDQPRCTDLTKARAYAETYRYDSMGNILRLRHGNGSGGFKRAFTSRRATTDCAASRSGWRPTITPTTRTATCVRRRPLGISSGIIPTR